MAVIEIPYTVEYKNAGKPLASEVARSLLGFDGIIQRSPLFLEEVYAEAHIDQIQVLVNSVQSGSTVQDLIIKLIWTDQATLDESIAGIRSRLRIDQLSTNHPILTTTVALTAAAGIYYAASRHGSAPAAITNSYNTTIAIGAERLEVDEDRIRELVDSLTSHTNDAAQLASDALQFVAPAKRGDPGAIVLNGDDDLCISRDVVVASPRDVPPASTSRTMRDFTDTMIIIRATDRDERRTGWRVRMPEISDRRFKMEVDSSIDTEWLGDQHEIIGDISVYFEANSDGNLVPRLGHLRSVAADEESLASTPPQS